jgi:hypothetical protein
MFRKKNIFSLFLFSSFFLEILRRANNRPITIDFYVDTIQHVQK